MARRADSEIDDRQSIKLFDDYDWAHMPMIKLLCGHSLNSLQIRTLLADHPAGVWFKAAFTVPCPIEPETHTPTYLSANWYLSPEKPPADQKVETTTEEMEGQFIGQDVTTQGGEHNFVSGDFPAEEPTDGT